MKISWVTLVVVLLLAPFAAAADLDRSAVDNDRFFVVLSGTWWMGTGEQFDPDRTVPAPAGSYVIHYGGKVHYDGAKDEETIIQVWGMGPATSTPVGPR